MKLLNLFPTNLFEIELEGDLKKEGKQTVKILGKFLLLGSENKRKLTDDVLLEHLKFVQKQNFFDSWFTDLISEMTNSVTDLIPDFLYIKSHLDKNNSSSKI